MSLHNLTLVDYCASTPLYEWKDKIKTTSTEDLDRCVRRCKRQILKINAIAVELRRREKTNRARRDHENKVKRERAARRRAIKESEASR